MRLSGTYKRIYVYSTLLLIYAVAVTGHPLVILPPLFFILFILFYALIAARGLRRVSPDWFFHTLTASPNPAVAGENVKVELALRLRHGEELPVDVKVESEGLSMVEGSQQLRSLARPNQYLSMVFAVTSRQVGIRNLGPVRLAVKDRLEAIVRELELPLSAPIVFLSAPQRLPISITARVASRIHAPGYSRDPIVGLEEDYRISLPETSSPEARSVDWRRLARTGGDETYVKEFDRRRSAEILYGLGSGLDIDVPGKGTVQQLALDLLLQIIFVQLREGSRPWLFQRMAGGKFSAARLFYGERGLRVGGSEDLPRQGLLIYLTRMTDRQEEIDIAKLVAGRKASTKILLLNLSSEAGRGLSSDDAEKLQQREGERLREAVARLGVWHSIVDLDSLPEALDRSTLSGEL
jgi:hypothetical protein